MLMHILYYKMVTINTGISNCHCLLPSGNANPDHLKPTYHEQKKLYP